MSSVALAVNPCELLLVGWGSPNGVVRSCRLQWAKSWRLSTLLQFYVSIRTSQLQSSISLAFGLNRRAHRLTFPNLSSSWLPRLAKRLTGSTVFELETACHSILRRCRSMLMILLEDLFWY